MLHVTSLPIVPGLMCAGLNLDALQIPPAGSAINVARPRFVVLLNRGGLQQRNVKTKETLGLHAMKTATVLDPTFVEIIFDARIRFSVRLIHNAAGPKYVVL